MIEQPAPDGAPAAVDTTIVGRRPTAAPSDLWDRLRSIVDRRGPSRTARVPAGDCGADPDTLMAPGTVRLDGAEGYPGLGDESIAAHTPLLTVSLRGDEWTITLHHHDLTVSERYDPAIPFAPLQRIAGIVGRAGEPRPDGALIGYLTYEFGERLLGIRPRPIASPEALFFVHDRIARHRPDGWEVSCSGLRAGLEAAGPGDDPRRANDLGSWCTRLPDPSREPIRRLRRDDGRGPVRVLGDSWKPGAYRTALGRVRRHIVAGDIYQANLTRMLELDIGLPAPEYYEALRSHHPAPFASYLVEPDGHAVLGISPELFLDVRGRDVRTQPIKGTRPRGRTPGEDDALRHTLWTSDKDAAELVMIVDLMRNDLGRVAELGSVRVPEPRRLDAHPTLFHLSGVVEARLREPFTVWDLLATTLPAGSITGAPKRRAVEILGELEPHPRGVYTGAVGLVDFAGNATFNVAIRTVRIRGSRGLLGVGGGIVADSDPGAELQETWDKARAFLLAGGNVRTPSGTR